jgi:branched-chain amino acid transport system substrate-binding protein
MNVGRFCKFAFVLAIVALIAGLSACDQIGQLLVPAPPEMEDMSAEIPIGVVVALTGRFADEIGIPMQNGFELAHAEINNSGMLGGAAITFITEDDQSESSVEAFNKLIHQDGVSAIIGLAISAQAIHAFPIAQENGVVAFSSVSSASGLSAIGDFIFRAGLTVDILNPSGVRITQEKLGYTKAATMYDESDLYSTSSHEGFQTALAENGVEIVSTETFQSGDTDFSAQLTRIMEANPEAIFISTLPPEMPLILSQGRELGIPDSVPFIIPEIAIEQVQAAGTAAEGVVTFTGWSSLAATPGNEVFIQSYTEKYGRAPNAWAAQSYATLHILAAAIAEAQSSDSEAIRDALANTMDLDTILGQFSFDTVGDAVYDPQILIVKDSEFAAFD